MSCYKEVPRWREVPLGHLAIMPLGIRVFNFEFENVSCYKYFFVLFYFFLSEGIMWMHIMPRCKVGVIKEDRSERKREIRGYGIHRTNPSAKKK